jgi:hypothetical protein
VPTSAREESAAIALPNTSNRQISPHRSGLSSSPTIHTEAMDVCASSIRARTSMRPWCGVHPHHSGCASRTTWPSANGCWPTRLPTGPEKTPDWTPETRNGLAWVSAHQSP